jgi:hypothetical protein
MLNYMHMHILAQLLRLRGFGMSTCYSTDTEPTDMIEITEIN